MTHQTTVRRVVDFTPDPNALSVVALSGTGSVGTVAAPVVVANLTPAVPTRRP
jgi:hypothetical protein